MSRRTWLGVESATEEPSTDLCGVPPSLVNTEDDFFGSPEAEHVSVNVNSHSCDISVSITNTLLRVGYRGNVCAPLLVFKIVGRF